MALLACTPDLPATRWMGDFLHFATDLDTTICEGTFPVQDRFVDHACDLADSYGCYTEGRAYTMTPFQRHELYHAVADAAGWDGPTSFAEGLAGVYSTDACASHRGIDDARDIGVPSLPPRAGDEGPPIARVPKALVFGHSQAQPTGMGDDLVHALALRGWQVSRTGLQGRNDRRLLAEVGVLGDIAERELPRAPPSSSRSCLSSRRARSEVSQRGDDRRGARLGLAGRATSCRHPPEGPGR